MLREPEMIAVSRLEALCSARGGTSYTSTAGVQAYHMPNGQTVRIPSDKKRIPEVVVREIAMIKLEMHEWEYDYWLTEQDNDGFSSFKMPASSIFPLESTVQKSEERADGLRAYHPGIAMPPASAEA